MYNVPDIYKGVTVASGRAPSVRAFISWERAPRDISWLRLDHSQLDTAALAIKSYSESEDPDEILGLDDYFYYSDETGYVINAEGREDLYGDLFQYMSSECDITLANSNDRFTPRTNKNKIKNGSFELGENYWNIASGISASMQIVGDDIGVVSGVNALRFNNMGEESVEDVFIYSDTYSIASGVGGTYTASVYAMGTGEMDLRLVSIASGITPLSSGVKIGTMASGEYNRFSITHTIPSNASGIYARVSVASGVGVFDCFQVEEGSGVTYFEDEFIGNYLLPRRPTRIQIQMEDPTHASGSTMPIITGVIKNIRPNLKNDITNVYMQDFSEELKTIYPSTVSSGLNMFQNYKVDDLIRELGYLAGLKDENMNLEVATTKIPFMWFQEGSAWYYMQNLAEAEHGRVFVDRDGNLNFWNRNHIAVASGSQFTMTMEDYISNIEYEVNDNKVYNSVVVKAKPREVQPLQAVWTLEAPAELKSGVQTEVWAEITDQDGVGLPCTSIVEPTSTGNTSRYKANSSSDGGGTDKTSLVSLSSLYNFGTSVRMNFYNGDPSPVYITQLVLYGTPAKIKSDIEVLAEDEDSIKIYGKQQLVIENDLIQSEAMAKSIASYKLDIYKDPINTVKIENVGIPYLEVGDKITVEDNYDGRFTDYTIIGHRWQLLGNDDFIQNLDLQKIEPIILFTLDVSQLDSSDKLYI